MNSAGNFFGSQKVCMNGLIKKKGRLNEETIFLFNKCVKLSLGFPDRSVGKESTWNAGVSGSIPGFRRSAGGGKSYPLQYSGLANSMDRSWGGRELDMTERLFMSIF